MKTFTDKELAKEITTIKQQLRIKSKQMNHGTSMIERHGIEFIYFPIMANGRKNVYKAGITINGTFTTKEI